MKENKSYYSTVKGTTLINCQTKTQKAKYMLVCMVAPSTS